MAKSFYLGTVRIRIDVVRKPFLVGQSIVAQNVSRGLRQLLRRRGCFKGLGRHLFNRSKMVSQNHYSMNHRRAAVVQRL
jgi:hypothetical protein